MSDKKKETPPTVITLTLPTPEGGGIAPERATATLLIQRGDLAHVKQFHYQGYLPDVMEAIREATEALGVLADNPPVVPDPPAEKPKSRPKKGKKAKSEAPPADEEPTIDVPLKKGTKAVKISHIKIVGGESDAVAYRQAITVAGRLIDGGLWDGESQIRFDDVYATAKKIKGLSDKEIGSLFTLEEFVQTGAVDEAPDTSDEDDSTGDRPPVVETASSNGHHPDDATTLL